MCIRDSRHDVCEDLSLGKGKLIALHLKETKPDVYREVPFLTGHVEFERIINTAWTAVSYTHLQCRMQ